MNAVLRNGSTAARYVLSMIGTEGNTPEPETETETIRMET
jgi:hypothetical protein